jgi:hypothetical protein
LTSVKCKEEAEEGVLRDREAEGDRCKDKWAPLAKKRVMVLDR